MQLALPRSDVLSVSAYAALLGRALRAVGGAVVEAEVQSASMTARGMLVFELTDGEARLAAKVFPRDVATLAHRPRPGDLIRARIDRPDYYEARGTVGVIVSAIELAGEGEMLRRRAELLRRLHQEGLCDPRRRRCLPPFPRAVGVIAGQGSDGMGDVVRALVDRWPAVHVVRRPSLVQGAAAPRQIVDALVDLARHPLVDVIVLARGGGSVQDLACFDDERLCRALSACPVPVVCAIGHTDNNPVCNHVAWPAFTPSRSAELVVPSVREIRSELAQAGERVAGVRRRLEVALSRITASGVATSALATLEARIAIVTAAGRTVARPGERLAGLARELEITGEGVRRATRRRLDAAHREAVHSADLIAARDVRRQGWALVTGPDGHSIRSVAQLHAGGRIRLRLSDGFVESIVETAIPDQQEAT